MSDDEGTGGRQAERSRVVFAAMSDDERPDFGPGGYLPDRAARQARKIILRAPLGLEWLVAAVIFGLVLLAAGATFLATRDDDAPAAPFVAVTDIDDLSDDGLAVPDLDTLLVRAGVVRAFAGLDTQQLVWCPATEQIEGRDGRRWSVTGRGLGGTPSLDTHPVVIHEGVVHVDPSRDVPGPSPDPSQATSACQ